MIAGAILAGGLSRRMGGGDKALREVGGVPLLTRTIARMAPQVGPLLLNANGDPARFAAFGLEVRADVLGDHAGPLAGILTALEWTAEQGAEWLLTAAADTPLLPSDLGARLAAERLALGARLAVAASGGRMHPVCALWPVDIRFELRHAVTEEELRRLTTFVERFSLARVEWPVEPFDPFLNVNTPGDLDRLGAILA